LSGQTSGLLNIHELSDSLLILSVYNLIICSVAAVLYVTVDGLEPNRRLASALKVVVVAVAVAASRLSHQMASGAMPKRRNRKRKFTSPGVVGTRARRDGLPRR
jgi:hypothetical protein